MNMAGSDAIQALENTIIFDALEAARIGLCVIDAEGQVAIVTSEFARKIGQSAAELLGRSARRIVGGQSFSIVRFAELIDINGAEIATNATYSLNDHVSVLLVQAKTFHHASYGKFRVLSILDIRDFGISQTQQIATRRELDAMSSAVVIAEIREGNLPIIYVNKRFEDLTGYSAADAVGKNCRFLQGKDTDAQQIAVIRDAIKTRKPCHVVLKNYRRDGSPFLNELFISPVFDAQGAATHFIGLQRETNDRF